MGLNRSRAGRRALVALLAAAGVVLAACGGGGQAAPEPGSSAPPTPLKVIVQAGNMQLLVPYVAHALGMDQRHGVDLDFVVSTQPLTPLLNSSADVTLVTPQVVITGRQQGYDIGIAGVLNTDTPIKLLVRNGLDIPTRSFADTFKALGGKTVGTTVVGGGLDNTMRYAMDVAGVDPQNGFTTLGLGTLAGMRTALSAGRVDAGLFVEPIATEMVQAGEAKLAFDYVADAKPKALADIPGNLVVVGPSLAANSAASRGLMETISEAAAFVADDANADRVASIAKETLLKDTATPDSVLRGVIGDAKLLLKSQCFTREMFDASYEGVKALGLGGTQPITFDQIYARNGALPSCSS